ncbi:flagellar protein FlaG [mine drainage metagenome]|uniref:Flagellar protein FlaG n=1 Tax=mine drainage metagenome TaxID=410659 RepID=A0A1J5RPD1_9ZZZZ
MINVSSSVASGVASQAVGLRSVTSGQNAPVQSIDPKLSASSASKAVAKVESAQSVKVDNSALNDAINKINAFIAPTSSVEFSVDKDSNRTVVKVIDLETKQVIRQYPNEDVLAMSKVLDKFQGLMVKQTA